MLDQRLNKRRHLIYNLRLEDPKTGALFGHLADISTDGLLVVGKQKHKEDSELHMLLQPPEGLENSAPLDFHARCMWSRVDVNPDYFVSGFKVLHPDDSHIDAVNKLVNELGFQD